MAITNVQTIITNIGLEAALFANQNNVNGSGFNIDIQKWGVSYNKGELTEERIALGSLNNPEDTSSTWYGYSTSLNTDTPEVNSGNVNAGQVKNPNTALVTVSIPEIVGAITQRQVAEIGLFITNPWKGLDENTYPDVVSDYILFSVGHVPEQTWYQGSAFQYILTVKINNVSNVNWEFSYSDINTLATISTNLEQLKNDLRLYSITQNITDRQEDQIAGLNIDRYPLFNSGYTPELDDLVYSDENGEYNKSNLTTGATGIVKFLNKTTDNPNGFPVVVFNGIIDIDTLTATDIGSHLYISDSGKLSKTPTLSNPLILGEVIGYSNNACQVRLDISRAPIASTNNIYVNNLFEGVQVGTIDHPFASYNTECNNKVNELLGTTDTVVLYAHGSTTNYSNFNIDLNNSTKSDILTITSDGNPSITNLSIANNSTACLIILSGLTIDTLTLSGNIADMHNVITDCYIKNLIVNGSVVVNSEDLALTKIEFYDSIISNNISINSASSLIKMYSCSKDKGTIVNVNHQNGFLHLFDCYFDNINSTSVNGSLNLHSGSYNNIILSESTKYSLGASTYNYCNLLGTNTKKLKAEQISGLVNSVMLQKGYDSSVFQDIGWLPRLDNVLYSFSEVDNTISINSLIKSNAVYLNNGPISFRSGTGDHVAGIDLKFKTVANSGEDLHSVYYIFYTSPVVTDMSSDFVTTGLMYSRATQKLIWTDYFNSPLFSTSNETFDDSLETNIRVRGNTVSFSQDNGVTWTNVTWDNPPTTQKINNGFLYIGNPYGDTDGANGWTGATNDLTTTYYNDSFSWYSYTFGGLPEVRDYYSDNALRALKVSNCLIDNNGIVFSIPDGSYPFNKSILDGGLKIEDGAPTYLMGISNNGEDCLIFNTRRDLNHKSALITTINNILGSNIYSESSSLFVIRNYTKPHDSANPNGSLIRSEKNKGYVNPFIIESNRAIVTIEIDELGSGVPGKYTFFERLTSPSCMLAVYDKNGSVLIHDRIASNSPQYNLRSIYVECALPLQYVYVSDPSTERPYNAPKYEMNQNLSTSNLQYWFEYFSETDTRGVIRTEAIS